MKIGVCRYCENETDLCLSHSIPGAFSKSVRRSSNGYQLVITKDQKKIIKSSDKGGAHLLCQDCENLFNETFDRYLVQIVRLIRNKYEEGKKLDLEIDTDKILRSLLSVFWRASESDEEVYSHIPPNFGSGNQGQGLKRLLFDSENITRKHFGVGMCAIAGISENSHEASVRESIRQITIPPMVSPPIWLSTQKKGKKYYMISMVFEGVYIFILLPRMGYPKNKTQAFLNPNKMSQSLNSRPLLKLPFVTESLIDIIREAFIHSASSS